MPSFPKMEKENGKLLGHMHLYKYHSLQFLLSKYLSVYDGNVQLDNN